MDFVTRCRVPFEQVVEALTATLAQRGFATRRNFDLRSAAGEDAAGVNYTVMLIRPKGEAERLHVVVAHEYAGRLTLTLASTTPVDEQTVSLRQALGEALVELGCWSWEEPRPNGRVVDPVCGKLLDPHEAHAVVEWNGQPVYLCCPLCQRSFEQEPQRYVTPPKSASIKSG